MLFVDVHKLDCDVVSWRYFCSFHLLGHDRRVERLLGQRIVHRMEGNNNRGSSAPTFEHGQDQEKHGSCGRGVFLSDMKVGVLGLAGVTLTRHDSLERGLDFCCCCACVASYVFSVLFDVAVIQFAS